MGKWATRQLNNISQMCQQNRVHEVFGHPVPYNPSSRISHNIQIECTISKALAAPRPGIIIVIAKLAAAAPLFRSFQPFYQGGVSRTFKKIWFCVLESSVQ